MLLYFILLHRDYRKFAVRYMSLFFSIMDSSTAARSITLKKNPKVTGVSVAAVS